MNRKDQKYRRLFALTVVVCLSGLLFAQDALGPERIQLRAIMPIEDTFSVEPYTGSQTIDLVSSRGKSIKVGTYTLASNRTNSSYSLNVLPGETGAESAFYFVAEETGANSRGESKIEYDLSIRSSTENGSSIEGARNAASKSLGVRDAQNIVGIVYETGEIFANIPDFDTAALPTGWYASAIQFQVLIN
ncbi:MAG: hypothetical protein SPD11_09280 [Sphaerochaetaceae bacterium]|nr:hypothetical protein [Sphaerochaetaceae bacterium]